MLEKSTGDDEKKSEQHFLLQFIFIHSTFLALGTRVLAAYNVSHSSFSKPVTIFKVQLDCHESQSSQCYLHCPCTPLIGCLQQQAQSNHVTKIYSYFCFSAFFFFFLINLLSCQEFLNPLSSFLTRLYSIGEQHSKDIICCYPLLQQVQLLGSFMSLAKNKNKNQKFVTTYHLLVLTSFPYLIFYPFSLIVFFFFLKFIK